MYRIKHLFKPGHYWNRQAGRWTDNEHAATLYTPVEHFCAWLPLCGTWEAVERELS